VQTKECGGLGILNLNKFALSLRIRWIWYDWIDEPKHWAILSTPCTPQDVELFAAATTVNKLFFGKPRGSMEEEPNILLLLLLKSQRAKMHGS
jgi:hypothetical protein